MLRLSLMLRRAQAATTSAAAVQVSSNLASTTTTTTLSSDHHQLLPDPSLVNLPAGVERCLVYRNVITAYDEDLIMDELSRILPSEGQSYYADPTKVDEKVLRNVYLELYGFKDFVDTSQSKSGGVRKDNKRIAGLAWSPTLIRTMSQGIGKHLMQGIEVDAARIVEHHLPGYEMHIEHPSVGRSFLYLNLMSDTVLTFDDEPTQRRGEVYLPQRSMMVCSGEARWGWRFGERPTLTKFYQGPNGFRKKVGGEHGEADMRLSIQMWRFDSNLIDRRQLQDDLENAVKAAKEKALTLQKEKEAQEAAAAKDDQLANDSKKLFTLPPKLKEQLANGAQSPRRPQQQQSPSIAAMGSLGGDMAPDPTAVTTKTPKSMQDIQRDMATYRKSFGNVQTVMKEMKTKQDLNEPITDAWLMEKAESARSNASDLDADYGFNALDPEGAWEEVDSRARLYKGKIKAMNYDGNKEHEPKAHDLGFNPDGEGALDIKETLSKLVPHMKDGDRLFAENDFGNLRNR